jgi:hypothetical protein
VLALLFHLPHKLTSSQHCPSAHKAKHKQILAQLARTIFLNFSSG